MQNAVSDGSRRRLHRRNYRGEMIFSAELLMVGLFVGHQGDL